MSSSQMISEHIQRIAAYKSENPAEDIERQLGIPIVQLGMNENPFGPSPKAVRAARAYLEKIAPYPDDSAYLLRQRLASHYKISMDEIIVSAGSSDVLAMTYDALHSPEAEVLTGEASFIVYYQLAEILNMPLVRTPMKGYAFDLEAMVEGITARTRLVVLANPNPTGTIIHRAELDKFMNRIPDHVLVVLDEAYFEYVSDSRYPNSLDYVRAGRPVLVLRTFSKVFGLAGLRIGYGISTAEIVAALYKVRMAFNTNSVAQIAALAAWDDREHVQKSVETNRLELEFLYRELSERHVGYIPSQANFILVELRKPVREVTSALLKQGVIVRPAWGCPACMRVSVGTREQNQAFLAALDKAL